MEIILIIILVINIFLALKLSKIEKILLILAKGEDQIIESIGYLQQGVNRIKND